MAIGVGTAMLAGSLIGGAASLYSGHQNRKFASAQTAFQAEREDTSMQRRVKDLRAAGLNPILAVGTPGAASAAGSQLATQPDIGQAMASGASAAAQGRRISSEVPKLDQEVENLGKQYDLTVQQIQKTKDEIWKIVNEAQLVAERKLGLSYENVSRGQMAEFLEDNGYLSKFRQVFDSMGIEARDATKLLGSVLNVIFGKIRISPSSQR